MFHLAKDKSFGAKTLCFYP